MASAQNIFLVGPMGAGKTTIGRQLAKTLGVDFIDSDQEIEQRTGATISWIFDIEGEAGFRSREAQVIDELSQRDGIVLATGGGAILDENNRSRLAARGMVVYLSAPLEQLLKRTLKDRSRPLLQTPDPRNKLLELIAIRDPLYRQIADFVIETDKYTVKSAVEAIVQHHRSA